jgi:hypothetical protein
MDLAMTDNPYEASRSTSEPRNRRRSLANRAIGLVLVLLGGAAITMSLRGLAMYYGFSGPIPMSFKGIAWLWLPLSTVAVVGGLWLIGGRRAALWSAAVLVPITVALSMNLTARPGFYYVDETGQPVFELPANES